MLSSSLLHLLFLLPLASCQYSMEEPILYGTFSPDFKWGAATAAYQVAGGWREGGKGPSIWDVWTEGGQNTADGSTGQVTSDSYNRWREDVKPLQALGLNSYMFSISWSRLMREGTDRVS